MSIIFNADPITGEFIGSCAADRDPVESNNKKTVYIIPAHSSLQAPTTPAPGHVSVLNEAADTWSDVEDNRGSVYDTSTGHKISHSLLGPLPANLTKKAPGSNQSWDKKTRAWSDDVAKQASTARADREQRIAAIKWRIERNAREMRLGITTSENITDLDAYVQALCDVPLQAGFPAKINWPTSP